MRRWDEKAPSRELLDVHSVQILHDMDSRRVEEVADGIGEAPDQGNCGLDVVLGDELAKGHRQVIRNPLRQRIVAREDERCVIGTYGGIDAEGRILSVLVEWRVARDRFARGKVDVLVLEGRSLDRLGRDVKPCKELLASREAEVGLNTIVDRKARQMVRVGVDMAALGNQ